MPLHARPAACFAGLLLAALALAPAGPATAQPAGAGERPRVGLVLGGGGARGAAHIGVLEVLERLRVPVDCVAGTSMGALVAGAWAAGLSPAQMRAALGAADWNDMFRDEPEHSEIDLRHKRLQQRFLPGSELGVTAAGLAAPGGVVAGQKIKLFFNQLVRADLGEHDLARLPLPVSIVATDIGTGERVVFREGSLTMAMRASMSVPGLMAPVDFQGRRLVDGGLVDNLPVREVRERCGAEVVIAVNVGSPLLEPASVGSLLTVSAQMVAILTEQNVSQSLATLRPGDLLLKPELAGIRASAFERSAETADRGRRAAEAQAEALGRLAVPAEAYAAWRSRRAGEAGAPPRVDAIEIAGLDRVNPEALARHIAQRVGEPLDVAGLHRDLLRAYGDGHYERIDYTLLPARGRNLLRIAPIEKPWGPDYLRFAIGFDSNLLLGSSYALRAAYQKTWMNDLGGELLASAEIGSTQALALEWYQPLHPRQRLHAQVSGELRRERQDLFAGGRRIAEYSVAGARIEAALGAHLGPVGLVQLGWRERRRTADLDIGQPLPSPVGLLLTSSTLDDGGPFLLVDLDQLNRLYFPTRGWAWRAGYADVARRGYSRASSDLRVAWPVGLHVLGARVAHTGSPRGRLPVHDAAALGGFLNLSGYARGQILGDEMHYLHLRAERILGRFPLGLRGDVRLGVALEAGRMSGRYTERQLGGWLDSATVYLGGESPLGPIYLGLGHSSRGSTNAYLVIGAP
jgi:NTE family protein